MFSAKLPVTPLGWGVAALAVVAGVAGWQLAWPELLVIGIGCALAFAVAVVFVVGRGELDVSREIRPERVEVGGTAESLLVVANPRRGVSSPRQILDRVGDRELLVDVPAIPGRHEWRSVQPLPTDRRGVFTVGPAVIAKADPLRLAVRNLGSTDSSTLYVHPRTVRLAALRSGFTKDLEGPTFDNSPAGDVAFHAIREYEPGDDVRRIHWMSTARTGEMMVRHYVDNRRPFIGVLVDDSADIDPAAFERALEVAASNVVAADYERRPLSVWVGAQEVVSSRRPATRDQALDRMCEVTQTADGPGGSGGLTRMLRTDPDLSGLLFVTGARAAVDVLPVVTGARRLGQVMTIRFVEPGTPSIRVPGARTLDCTGLDDFAAKWRAILR